MSSPDEQPENERSGPLLYRRARERIPGGTQLLTKRPEMILPEQWPAYYSEAQGAEIWDLDGRRFLDMSYSGIGSCILGFADEDVDRRVREVVDRGSMSTLNCPEEVELAELLCDLHPWAEMVRYARTGGEAMAMAVRIARAATGCDTVAFCGYHGWHDWYLAANLHENDALDGHLLSGLDPAGVPRELTGSALPFRYNHPEDLQEIVSQCGDSLAAVIIEPIRFEAPENGFLDRVRKIATESGVPLIFDEITSGWRYALGGAHLEFGIDPDIAVFAKGMSNGYPMAAVIGRRSVMNAAQTTFISSTFWTERIGPTAALATIRKLRDQNVTDHLWEMGSLLKEGWEQALDEAGLPVRVKGMPPLLHLDFKVEEPRVVSTLFTQEMLERGFLASDAFYPCYAHTEDHVQSFVESSYEVFSFIRGCLHQGTLLDELNGPIAHAGFERLT